MNSVELRNIDALIAEAVYKTRIAYRAEDDELVSYNEDKVIPFWSTNISCAWDLIKKLQEDYPKIKISFYWDSNIKLWLFCIRTNKLLIETEASTFPLAICKAVLKLHEKA